VLGLRERRSCKRNFEKVFFCCRRSKGVPAKGTLKKFSFAVGGAKAFLQKEL
jgi:hypothetical protein